MSDARPIELGTATAADTPASGPVSRPRRTLADLLRASPVATVGAVIVGFWVLAALLAPWLAPYPPNKVDPALLAYPFPSAEHWLGVDHLGRDILSRILWGARTVLTVAPPTRLIALTLPFAYATYATRAYQSMLADAAPAGPTTVHDEPPSSEC